MKMLRALKAFWNDEAGGEAVEWPFVVGLVILVGAGLWIAISDEVERILPLIVAELQQVGA